MMFLLLVFHCNSKAVMLFGFGIHRGMSHTFTPLGTDALPSGCSAVWFYPPHDFIFQRELSEAECFACPVLLICTNFVGFGHFP